MNRVELHGSGFHERDWVALGLLASAGLYGFLTLGRPGATQAPCMPCLWKVASQRLPPGCQPTCPETIKVIALDAGLLAPIGA